MNSWGQHWGDGGFLRIQNAKVLPEMEFFDVYWNEDDLYSSEKKAFKKKGANETYTHKHKHTHTHTHQFCRQK